MERRHGNNVALFNNLYCRFLLGLYTCFERGGIIFEDVDNQDSAETTSQSVQSPVRWHHPSE